MNEQSITFRLASSYFLVAVIMSGCANTSHQNSVIVKQKKVDQRDVLRESFDPQKLKEETPLVQPTFSRTTIEVDPQIPAKTPARTDSLYPAISSKKTDYPDPIKETSSFSKKIYRVQLLALSNKENALSLQKSLTNKLQIPIYVEAKGDLFLIQAGNFKDLSSAEDTKKQIKRISSEYDDAFVITLEKFISITDRDSLSTKKLEPSASIQTSKSTSKISTFGWRVLLDQFLLRDQASELKSIAITKLNRRDIDIIFKAPWYKVEVGHYASEGEVQIATERIRKKYPNAIKVRSQVILQESN